MLAEPMPLSTLRELGSQRAEWGGGVQLAALPRLEALLHVDASRDDELCLLLRFELEPNGTYTTVAGSVSGQLGLVCQRCLGELRWTVPVTFELMVVANETDLLEPIDPFDVIVAGAGGLDLRTVVEDELLAALPLAPMHAAGEQCFADVIRTRPAAGSGASVQKGSGASSGCGHNRPFAGLSALLQSGDGQAESSEN